MSLAMFPQGWTKSTLGKITRIERVTIDPKKIESGTTYVGLENISGEGQFNDVRSVESGEIASSKFAFNQKHLLYGKLRPYLKKIARPFFSGVCSTDILPILVGDKIDRNFLYYCLRQPQYIELATARSTGANLPRLSPKELAEFTIPLPPLEEQRRIVGILDKADEVRRKRQEAIRLTEELLRSLFLDMFGDPVANPMGWEVKKLVELIDHKRPITYGILKPGSDIESGIPYIRVVDMKNGTVDYSIVRQTTPEIAQQYSRSTLKTGDLLLSIRGHVGRLATTPPELDGANITQDTARLAIDNMLTTEFLFGLLDSEQIQNWMKKRTKGAGVKGINLGDVKEIPTPIPPLHLQKNFSTIFNNIRSQQEKDRIRELNIDNLFNCLLQKAFRGEL